MKLFFDTEFTGLHKNTTLISIGIVSENGQQFYAELTDYDKNAENDKWIKENVIDNLLTRFPKDIDKAPYVENLHVGDKDSIAKSLEIWLKQFDYVELVSDCCHYDMVLFCDLFGGAFYIPKNVCPTCYDINQDIAQLYGISQQKAFDKNRESILKEFNDSLLDLNSEMKHNSLWDAYVIKEIYEIVQSHLFEGENNG